MSCSHKRIWEDATVYSRKEADVLLKNGWEPMNYDFVRNFTFHFKRQKPCEECPKELQMQQEVMTQLQKEEAERVRKFDSYAKQEMIKRGRLY